MRRLFRVVKNPPASVGNARDMGLIPGSEISPEKAMAIHSSIFLLRKSHGQRSLVGNSLWGSKGNMTERLSNSKKKKKKMDPV